jgi:putative PIN family toxin of toxin-antitoxin system
MKRPRVTLDTNVLAAGPPSRRGASFRVLEAWGAGRFLACASVPLWLEYEAVLKRTDIAASHGFSASEVDVLLGSLAAHVEPVDLHFTWRAQLRDPGDEMVFETAMNGRADALVTFNQADFRSAAKRFGLELWHPSDLLAAMRRKT